MTTVNQVSSKVIFLMHIKMIYVKHDFHHINGLTVLLLSPLMQCLTSCIVSREWKPYGTDTVFKTLSSIQGKPYEPDTIFNIQQSIHRSSMGLEQCSICYKTFKVIWHWTLYSLSKKMIWCSAYCQVSKENSKN